jgi:hypothetical protein
MIPIRPLCHSEQIAWGIGVACLAPGARFAGLAEAFGIRSAVRSTVKPTLISARKLPLTVKELRP